MGSMTCLLERAESEGPYGAPPSCYNRSEAGLPFDNQLVAASPRILRRTSAPRDQIRVGPCATSPRTGGALAPAPVAAAGVHRRAGEPGHRVCRLAPAGAVLWAVALHLGHPDRADPDLPDHWVLRWRPVGRPPSRCAAAVSIDRRGGSAYGRHPARVTADPIGRAEWL